jgi:hypothetical protein
LSEPFSTSLSVASGAPSASAPGSPRCRFFPRSALGCPRRVRRDCRWRPGEWPPSRLWPARPQRRPARWRRPDRAHRQASLSPSAGQGRPPREQRQRREWLAPEAWPTGRHPGRPRLGPPQQRRPRPLRCEVTQPSRCPRPGQPRQPSERSPRSKRSRRSPPREAAITAEAGATGQAEATEQAANEPPRSRVRRSSRLTPTWPSPVAAQARDPGARPEPRPPSRCRPAPAAQPRPSPGQRRSRPRTRPT